MPFIETVAVLKMDYRRRIWIVECIAELNKYENRKNIKIGVPYLTTKVTEKEINKCEFFGLKLKIEN